MSQTSKTVYKIGQPELPEGKHRTTERRSRRAWILVVGIGVLLLTGVAGYLYLSNAPRLTSRALNETPTAIAPQTEKEERPVQGPEKPAPGTVMLSPRKQQLIGVQTTTAQVRPLTYTIRTVGLVEVDERRLAHVHIKLKGWIEKLYVRFTGEAVKKGQKLFEIYSPDLVATQEEYLLALKSVRSLGESEFPEVAEGWRKVPAEGRVSHFLRGWDRMSPSFRWR